ncbi:IS607 family transposase, partial [Nodularia spumigena]
QIPATGTIIVETDEPVEVEPVALIYARVSSAEAKPNLERQATRLSDYATARGYRIYKVVKEVGSGLNDNRKLLTNALQDKNYNILVAEHRDRVTRFGLNYIKLLLSATGKRLEIVNDADNGKDELMQDLVSVITSFVQRIYGLRRAKRKTEKIITELHNNGGEG